jgi:hypothetical protein
MVGDLEREERSADKRIAICANKIGEGAGMKFLRLIRAVLREIFDEAAYERFCARENLQLGHRSYAKFLHSVEQVRRVKCC